MYTEIELIRRRVYSAAIAVVGELGVSIISFLVFFPGDVNCSPLGSVRQEEYMEFGPILVLYCRGPVWTTPPEKVGIIITPFKGRPALTRYLAGKYTAGKVGRCIVGSDVVE